MTCVSQVDAELIGSPGAGVQLDQRRFLDSFNEAETRLRIFSFRHHPSRRFVIFIMPDGSNDYSFVFGHPSMDERQITFQHALKMKMPAENAQGTLRFC